MSIFCTESLVLSLTWGWGGWAGSRLSPWLWVAPGYNRKSWEHLGVILPSDKSRDSVPGLTLTAQLVARSLSPSLPLQCETAERRLSLGSVMVISSFLGCPMWFIPNLYFCVATTRHNFSTGSCLFWTDTWQVSYTTLFKNTDLFAFTDSGQSSYSEIPWGWSIRGRHMWWAGAAPHTKCSWLKIALTFL